MYANRQPGIPRTKHIPLTKASSPFTGQERATKTAPFADERPPLGKRAESGSSARKVRRARSWTLSRVRTGKEI